MPDTASTRFGRLNPSGLVSASNVNHWQFGLDTFWTLSAEQRRDSAGSSYEFGPQVGYLPGLFPVHLPVADSAAAGATALSSDGAGDSVRS
jgi:hypothetical protein